MTEGSKPVKPDGILLPAGKSPPPNLLMREVALLVPNMVKLVGRLLRDPRVPRRSKIVLGMAAAYVASPIDLIPDVIPVVGWADDVIILLFAIDKLIERAGPDLVDEHWDGSGDLFSLVREVIGLSRRVLPKRLSSAIDRLSG